MKLRHIMITGAMALTGFSQLALADIQPLEPVPYHYGMPLQIDTVISMSEQDTRHCEVITAHMEYIDTAGDRQHISYRKLADACHQQN
jgi:hypothetical protein